MNCCGPTPPCFAGSRVWVSILVTASYPKITVEVVHFAATVIECGRYYWITGRVDDVVNVSGHRIGTAEVEGALEEHPACSEAAVVG